MSHRSRPRRRRVGVALLLAALSLPACKPAAAPLAETIRPRVASEPEPAATSPAPPLAAPPTTVYGHFRVSSPAAFIAALRSGPLPEAQRTLFTEEVLRSMLAMALASGSSVAERIDLARPLGCVITSFRVHDVPLACVVGYQGGLSGLVQDLGPQGFVSGGDGYAAYRFDGRGVYLAAMGDHVAFAFAPDLVAATRDRLQRDVLDAPPGDEELLITAFPSAIFSDAKEEILDAMVPLRRMAPSTDPGQQAIVELQTAQWESWADLERMDLWLDVSPERFRFGYRGTARAGTATDKSYAAAAAIAPVAAHRSLMAQLPASALLVMGMRLDMGSLLEDPLFAGYEAVVAAGGGQSPALAEKYRESLGLWRELTDGHAAGALLHERGTKGGVVLVYGLRPGVDAMGMLRRYFESIAPVTPAEALVTTKLRPGALRVGKLRADVLELEPSAKLLATPSGVALGKALGSPPRLELAFVQRGETLLMAMVSSKPERYLQRALAAADGRQPLGNVTAARELLETNAGATLTFAAGFAGIARWLARIDAIAPLPFPVVERRDDAVLVVRPAGERQRELTLDVSATMLDALSKLGG